MQLEMENIRGPRAETSVKYYKAKDLMASGTPMNDACAKVGMARITFRAFEEKHDPNPLPGRGPKKRGPKPKSFIDIPMKNAEPEIEDDKAVIIVCKTSQLKNILKGL